MDKDELNQLSEQIIGAAIEVHRELGPGILEHSYEAALQHELALHGISSVRQLLIPLTYKGLVIPDSYRIDLLVEDRIVVELKTVKALEDVHTAQVLTYLRMSGKSLGLLINFNVPLLRQGLKRIVHNFPS
jgi:GxxExxY protein